MPIAVGHEPVVDISDQFVTTPTDQRAARSLEALERRLAPGRRPIEIWRPILLVNTGDQIPIELDADQIPTMLTVQVFTGVLDIVFGMQSGANDPPTPYFQIGVIGVPVHIPLAPRQARSFTFWANVGPARASVLFHSPA